MTVLIIVLIFVFTSIDPPKVLFTAALCYGLSGPALALWRRRQRARRRSSSS
jgi:CDP-diacylglycerol--serine O-phosphatidyltransferase